MMALMEIYMSRVLICAAAFVLGLSLPGMAAVPNAVADAVAIPSDVPAIAVDDSDENDGEEKSAPRVTDDGLARTDVLGVWKAHGDAIVDIAPCGDSVCGELVWFIELETADGPILDKENPDEDLRSRELKGIQLVYGFVEKRKGWRKGRIYDPESGKTYKSKLTRLSAREMKVEGCVGPICKEFIWTKLPDDTITAEGLDEAVIGSVIAASTGE